MLAEMDTIDCRQRHLCDGRLVLQPYKQWSEERSRVLEKLWREGRSQSVIANILGVTTNAIAGRISRMDLRFLADRPKPVRKPRAHRAPKPWSERKKYYPNRRKIAVSNEPHIAPMPLQLVPDKGCRYIGGNDHLYCGTPQADGSSYCAYHHHIVWTPPRARERDPRPR